MCAYPYRLRPRHLRRSMSSSQPATSSAVLLERARKSLYGRRVTNSRLVADFIATADCTVLSRLLRRTGEYEYRDFRHSV